MKNTILGCAVTAALLNVGAASAGGLWLNEYGDFSGGRASAGSEAGMDDAASIMHNPASSSRIKGNQLFASGGALIPDVKFDVEYTSPRLGTGNGGDAGETAPVGSAAYVHDFQSDRWSGGVYFLGLAGAGLDYDNDWAGRYQATKVDLLLAAIVPNFAYRVSDRLSLGLAVQYWYSNLNVHLNVPRLVADREDARASINGDDSGFSFKLGSMYELTDRTRFGLIYQSEIKPEYDGDFKIVAPGGGMVLPGTGQQVSVRSELNFAEYVRFAMHHALDEKWAVNLTVGWDNWSQLGDVPLATENRGAAIPTKWRDTYHYAWGVEYQLDQRWALTSGVAYDTNPVDKEDRNAQLPVDRQVRYAFGARYALSDTLHVGGYINYADLGKSRIAARNFGGEYQNNGALGLSANVNWTF
ncbi:MAG: outer membrane protein transport protein [Halieaceae bacterium]|jgi:long-chain fatty acid transport protein|nr:outer membrane protein transport protein [Halieaceae bacterium]